jgi:hypothetical protein
MALNEILFMQLRLFRQFCVEQGLSTKDGESLWTECGVWDYIQDNYSYLHTNGDKYILSHITDDLCTMGKIKQPAGAQ